MGNNWKYLLIESFTAHLYGGGVGADTTVMADRGFSAPTNQQELLRRPTSARTVLRLRVRSVANSMANATTVTLYKNGVATALLVTIPAGTTGAFLEDGFPIVFVDGDDYDLVVADPAADPAGELKVSATIEGS